MYLQVERNQLAMFRNEIKQHIKRCEVLTSKTSFGHTVFGGSKGRGQNRAKNGLKWTFLGSFWPARGRQSMVWSQNRCRGTWLVGWEPVVWFWVAARGSNLTNFWPKVVNFEARYEDLLVFESRNPGDFWKLEKISDPLDTIICLILAGQKRPFLGHF